MKNLFFAALVLLIITGCGRTEKQEEIIVMDERPVIILETDFGNIKIELFPQVAPNHCYNFLKLVNSNFYDGLEFHRVLRNQLIQAGDTTGKGNGHAGYVIDAEFSNLQHLPGTVAMARGLDPNSASCQFYICVAQLPELDGKYTVFGQVIEGLDVARRIGQVKVDERNWPLEPVHIIRAYEEGKEKPTPPAEGGA